MSNREASVARVSRRPGLRASLGVTCNETATKDSSRANVLGGMRTFRGLAVAVAILLASVTGVAPSASADDAPLGIPLPSAACGAYAENYFRTHSVAALRPYFAEGLGSGGYGCPSNTAGIAVSVKVKGFFGKSSGAGGCSNCASLGVPAATWISFHPGIDCMRTQGTGVATEVFGQGYATRKTGTLCPLVGVI